MAPKDDGDDKGMTIRRRLFWLMRRERSLARKIHGARAAGVDAGFASAEAGALIWALRQLEQVHPEAAANARRDIQRDEERRESAIRARIQRAPRG